MDLRAHSKWAVLSPTTSLDRALKLHPLQGGPKDSAPPRIQTTPATSKPLKVHYPCHPNPVSPPGGPGGCSMGKPPPTQGQLRLTKPLTRDSPPCLDVRGEQQWPGSEEGVQEPGPQAALIPLASLSSSPCETSLMSSFTDVETEASRCQLTVWDSSQNENSWSSQNARSLRGGRGGLGDKEHGHGRRVLPSFPASQSPGSLGMPGLRQGPHCRGERAKRQRPESIDSRVRADRSAGG